MATAEPKLRDQVTVAVVALLIEVLVSPEVYVQA